MSSCSDTFVSLQVSGIFSPLLYIPLIHGCSAHNIQILSSTNGFPFQGLGLDWGVSFLNVRVGKDSDMVQQQEQEKENKGKLKKEEPPKPCSFSKQFNEIKAGKCGPLGGCMLENVYFFGSSCQWKNSGDSCEISTNKIKTIHGICSPGKP